MSNEKRYTQVIDKLRAVGLRPTRQRIALASLLFDGTDKHVCAEDLHRDVINAESRVSLATVYNTLHQFTDAGLLREIVISAGRSYFDTNVSDHHHFYFEKDGGLEDINSDEVVVAQLPTPPKGQKISRVDVVVRVSED